MRPQGGEGITLKPLAAMKKFVYLCGILKATDGFEITGRFEVDTGAEFTVIKQDCPD